LRCHCSTSQQAGVIFNLPRKNIFLYLVLRSINILVLSLGTYLKEDCRDDWDMTPRELASPVGYVFIPAL